MNDDIISNLQAGFSAHQAGDLDRAAGLYRNVLAHVPDNPDALHLLGVVILQQGDPAGAIESIERSLAADSENPQALDHLATALQELGRFEEAATALEKALEMVPEFAEAWFNLGNARESFGEFSGAIEAYQKAISLEPEFVEAHANLGSAYVEDRRFEDALLALEQALTLEPGLAPAWLSKGNALRNLGRTEEAIAAYGEVLSRDSENSMLHCLIADCHHDLGQDADALSHFESAHSLDPSDENALIGIAFCQIRDNDLANAETTLEKAIAAAPGNRRALAYKSVLLNLAGRSGEVAAFADYELDVAVLDLPAPEGMDSLASFNRVLADALKADSTLMIDPGNKTTRGGLQSGELTATTDPTILSFHQGLTALLDQFLPALEPRPGHPQFDTIPSDYRIESWSTILNAEGHQLSHIHPTAWLSGVYYVQLPPEVSENDPDHKGWIEFGGSGYDLPEHDGPVRLVPPAEGRLVLFPSYFLHRTVPFQSATQRISIAFDLIPIDPANETD
ncbi:MAG: hypothetical protein CMM48_17695 [Rhodospirillaceae bacterium]|nr:hypothetical protein [Rhodospirillaceae bacterium]HAA92407.1 hypothetical protein [Rhodospirillaceae bacterium]